MSPCNYNCSLCDILQINKRQLADLNQVREYLEDLCYHESTCHQEVTAKLNIVNGMLRDKIAMARRLNSDVTSATPTRGLPMNKPTNNPVSHNKCNPRHQTSPWQGPAAGASKFRTQWGRKQSNGKERVWSTNVNHSLHSHFVCKKCQY